MEMKGWVKIHRRLINWQHYGNPNVKIVFLHLILTANYEDTKTDKGVEVKRGQVVISTYNLANTLGISRAKIRQALKNLQQSGEIILQANSHYSLITINEYSGFQGKNSEKMDNLQSNPQSNLQSSPQNSPQNNPQNEDVKSSFINNYSDNQAQDNTQDNPQSSQQSNLQSSPQSNLPIIRNKEDKEVKEDKELKNIHTQQNSVATPKVVAPVTVYFKNSFSESLNTPPEGKEKKKVPRKRKENPVLLAKGAEYLPKGSKENNYVNYAIYFHRLLEPVHGGKYTFDHANAYKWAKDMKTLLEKHKRGLEEMFDLVKWVVDHSDDSLVYMQSPSFLAKNDGINYDRLLSKREFEQKKIDKLNGKAPTKISTPKYLN